MFPTSNPAKARRPNGNMWGLCLFFCALFWGGLPVLAAGEAAGSAAPPVGMGMAKAVGAVWRVELLPKRRTTLSSEMAARIITLGPREGRRFEKGEVLVAFDCAMEAAQMQRARAMLDAAEAKSQVSDRLSRLQATSKLEERVAQAEAAQARAELAIIQVKINHCQVQAPFAGRVIALSAQEHQFVKAGDPLMEILDEQSLEVVFLLPSRQLPQLAVGERFQVYIDETQRAYPARIVAFGALIDSVSQSVKVFGSIDGSFPDLLPGMSGVVQLATSEAAPAPVPSSP
ncbi:MAG: efflux RND transporter periplasmic adaptor subunit [Magnetococcales bacterium]|nr:efflux RND transporter periplasmic adaptor subunit [Magnetococcales bacterium]